MKRNWCKKTVDEFQVFPVGSIRVSIRIRIRVSFKSNFTLQLNSLYFYFLECSINRITIGSNNKYTSVYLSFSCHFYMLYCDCVSYDLHIDMCHICDLGAVGLKSL